MMAAPSRAKFEAAQKAACVARRAIDEIEIDLAVKYGRGNERWASRAEQKRLEQRRAQWDRACDRVWRMLQGAPRDWGTGVPVWWICEKLTYDDAFRPTNEPLSVVPPLSYGQTAPIRSLLDNFPNPLRLLANQKLSSRDLMKLSHKSWIWNAPTPATLDVARRVLAHDFGLTRLSDEEVIQIMRDARKRAPKRIM
jgi:hypothetical protein